MLDNQQADSSQMLHKLGEAKWINCMSFIEKTRYKYEIRNKIHHT